jgi:hypothetical protein
MPSDPELESRGRLVRSLGNMREMLPGSFVEHRHKCGQPTCRCASGKPEDMHAQTLLSVRWQGKRRTFHIPADLVEEVRSKVELHKRFQQAEEAICGMNLRRLLERKQNKNQKGREKG